MTLKQITIGSNTTMWLCLGIEIYLVITADNLLVRVVTSFFALGVLIMIVVCHIVSKESQARHKELMQELEHLDRLAEALDEIRQLEELWESPDSENDT